MCFVLFALGSARACMPLTPPSAPSISPANVALGVGLSELGAQAPAQSVPGLETLPEQNVRCALKDFEVAITGYRRQVQATHEQSSNPYAFSARHKALGYLADSLVYAGLANDRFGNTSASMREWLEATKVYREMQPNDPRFARGDSAFLRHKFREAFDDYRASVFRLGAVALNPIETDSGAQDAIDRGLTLASQGRFRAAMDQFAASPESQTASYLEGQAARAIGKISAARRAYISALFSDLSYPSEDEHWINDIADSALLQLLNIEKGKT
jgi:hypothetical protein